MPYEVCAGHDDYLNAALRAVGESVAGYGTARDFDEWHRRTDRLQAAMHRRAALINSSVNIAAAVENMDEFWRLVDATDRGETESTYWDTYENGRRRQIECVLATVYQAEKAILLNCGMSAVAVALGGCKVTSGTRLLVGRARYFETSGYLDRYLRPMGVEIHEVDVSRSNALAAALANFRPQVVFLETVANMPSVDAPLDITRWAHGASAPLFVIDNSTQSVLTKWFDLLDLPDRLLVVESGTKYLTNDIMCGVVFGAGDLLETARHFARDTGQFLQARALCYLDAALIKLLPMRMAIHSRNVRYFASQLVGYGVKGLRVSSLDKHADASNAGIFTQGVGSLLYVECDGCEASHYKQLLTLWREAARVKGDAVVPDVRAGFGWMKTSARVYETARLNRADAPSYMRISIGLEDIGALAASAQCLAEAVNAVMTADSSSRPAEE